MAINFPNSPSDGQEITEGNITYVYNASKSYWESTEDSSGASTTVYANMTALIAATGMSNGDQAFVTGNNNLYIYSGSGWYKVATVQNDAPSAITGVAGTYELAIDGTATTITAVSTDPEGFPLTWSYSTSGLGSIATVSQSDNVFTITPSTTVSDVGTFSLTINATDGVNGAVSTTTNLTLEFIVIVTNSKYTTLLATAVDTSDNNNITDSSSNTHSITVNGDAHAGTFSPYRSGGYSVHLDDGEEISFPDSSNYNLSNGSFSIEAWVYPTSYDSPWSGVISQFSSSSRGWGLAFSSTQITFLGSTNGGSSTNVNGSVTSSVPLNQWTHLLVTRDSNTIRIFNNGVLVNNFTETGTFNNSTNPLRIGELNSDASENFRGYIKDARVVKGSVPTEYQTSSTTNGATIFSVPSEPLTAVTDTVLLSCHLAYISDGSANNATPTLSGIVNTHPFAPYDYLEYSATDHGGSVYFDGSGDNLTVSSFYDFAGNGYSISFWFRLDNLNSNQSLVTGNNTNIGAIQFRYSNVQLRCNYTDSSGQPQTHLFGPTIRANEWYYVQQYHNGTTSNNVRLYVNGVQEAIISGMVSGTSSPVLYIGDNNSSGGTAPLYGYISDLKITTETSPVTAIPSDPRSSDSNTKFLLKGTDASIIDKSQRYNIDLGSTSIVGHLTTKWSGANSIYINSNSNNSDLITLPAGVLDASKPFTIEMWLRTNSGAVSGFWSIYTDATNLMRLKMRGDDRLEFYHRSGSYEQEIKDETNTYLLNNTDFYHVAVTRDANSVFYMHQNGIKLGNFTASADYNSSDTPFIIGKSQPATERYMEGYIQDFRITQGLARYTAADESSNIPSAPLEG